MVDPRLEAIVERMLDKYVYLYLYAIWKQLIYMVGTEFLLFGLGVFWTGSINRLWEWLWNAEDWIS